MDSVFGSARNLVFGHCNVLSLGSFASVPYKGLDHEGFGLNIARF